MNSYPCKLEFGVSVLMLLATVVSGAISCHPYPPCTSCRLAWHRGERNHSSYGLCIRGRYYVSSCKKGHIFSLRLRCCVRSENRVWGGCENYLPRATRIPPTVPSQNYTGIPCGVQIMPRIIPANPSMPGSWPWQISLQLASLTKPGEFDHICGGTLINDQWVLTAAHCINGYGLLMRVVLGAYNLNGPSPLELDSETESFFVHPSYTTDINRPNDIALIKLSRKVRFQWYILPSCMPESEHFVINRADDCWITGWGDTGRTGDSNVLNELKVSVTNRKYCNESWDGLVLDTNLCVGNGTRGACSGDSGGPLVCRREGRFILAGVTSWGAGGCDFPGRPNVYTRVASYLGWISNTIRNNP